MSSAKKSYEEILYEIENMYTVNVRAGLEAEKELLPNPTETSLNAICLFVNPGFSLTPISLPCPLSGLA